MDRAIAYATLEISPEATPEEVRAAYRRRAFATHPDRAGGDAAAFRAVCDAFRSLSYPALHGAQEPGPASDPDTSTQVPPTDAAKVLFEYLSDLASDMILNGATPETVVSFLAREGCPESVARALERDLRDRVQPAPSNPPAAPEFTEPPAAAPPVVPSVARQPRFPRWLAVTVAAAAVAACIVGAYLVALPARSPAKSAEVAPQPAAVAAAPTPPTPPTPPSAPAPAPAPARPPRSAPARPSAQQAPRPLTRGRERASPRSASAELDAERNALEADQKRFAAEVAELEAERGRIDAAEAALASASDVERFASLTHRKAAYNARVQMARRTEKALERRVRDLNAKILAYNDRVRSGR